MSKEEIIEAKLGMIYEQLFEIQWKLDNVQYEKREKEIKEKKRDVEREMEEIHYRKNDYWNLKDEKMREFNHFYGMEEKND